MKKMKMCPVDQECVGSSGFGLAKVRSEGSKIPFDSEFKSSYRNKPSTCYVERQVPVLLESEVNTLIDNFLVEKGYTYLL